MDAAAASDDIIAAARRARDSGDFPSAFRLLKTLAQERPRDLIALGEYGGLCRALGMLDRAQSVFEQMLTVDPAYVAALNNLAVLRADCGDPVGADEMFRRALACAPGNRDIHTNLLSNAQYVPGITPKILYDLHCQWDAMHASAGTPEQLPATHDTERPLRLGFVSADFCHHPVAYFMLSLFEALDRTAFSIHCFAQGERPDHMTPRFKAVASTWDRIETLNDQDAAAMIRAREIDILFDMAGHTVNNRLGVFRLRPAHLQIAWIGYLGTTGLKAIDYVLADHNVAPPEDAPFYAEKIIRLPHIYVAYTPPADAPEVSPPPLRANGYVTFGGFHNPAKVNAAVLATWAEILRRVPHARLLLKFRGIDADANRRRILAAMAEAGVDESRIAFSGPGPHQDFLTAYGQVDIALDPFPFTGGVTTCEALWMGVPIVSLSGATFPGRHTAGYLATIGLSELVAKTAAEYVEKAVGLAADADRVGALRATMRARMRASPLLDHAGYGRDFATAMRNVWRTYCEGRA